ncbi:MAG: diguanylate cyclase [Hyphomicrobium sp.]|nr:MAG: diguanylate cyclase [Hyphomicrobium sp.]
MRCIGTGGRHVMYRVLTCLGTEHDHWLVSLAVLVCVATALTSFLMYSVAGACGGRRMLLWAALTGVSAGSGIWATHFVAMLAYRGALPTHYEPVATIASLLIAIAVAAAGFVVSTGRSRLWAGLGGILIGLAIGTMHFAGMAALVIPGTIAWDTTLVAAAWILGCAIAGAALLAFHASDGYRAILRAGGLLALAICALHFTAMSAVLIEPDPTIAFQGFGMNRSHLAVAIALVSFIVLLSAFSAAVVQRANMRCEATLRARNSLFEAALRYLPVGLSMFDGQQRLIMCNPAYRKLYSLSEDLTRAGASFAEIVANLALHEGRDGACFSVARHQRKLGSGTAFTETVRLNDGRTISKRVGPIAGGGWVDVQEDITERIEQDAKIAYMAQHDILTGLANRAQLLQQLDAMLKRRRRGEMVAVLLIDLDRFKPINDRLGHLVGDALLRGVAARLRGTVREPDLVARLGGDEFVILQITAQPAVETAELAARIVATLSAPYEVDGRILEIGASIGIAVSSEGSEEGEAVLGRADTALYWSKAAGGAGYCFFNEDRRRKALEHTALVKLPMAS